MCLTPYRHARPAIKTGDLLAFSHGDWRSWKGIKVNAVRIFTRSEYSHVGMAIVMGGRVWLLEAVKPLVRIVPLSGELPAYWASVPFDVPADVVEAALSYVGKAEYSELEAVRAFFGHDHSDNLWECAELVKYIYSLAGVVLPGKATPTDVVRDIQRLGSGVVLIDEVP